MILILSQSAMEPTTEEVMDWLELLGAPCQRLNGEDFDGGARLSISLDGSQVTFEVEGLEGSQGDGVRLPLEEIGAVWFRRFLRERRHEALHRLTADPKLDYDIRRHLTQESRKLNDFLFASLAGRPWLSHPKAAGLTKLDVLHRAARAGLDIPATLVTTERTALHRFVGEHGTVITKPIGEVDIFLEGERSHILFTTALDQAAVEALPERFAPSLFQERLDKTYEVRAFYLAGEFHAMAIFSQADPQTQTDFRNYNRVKPNRNVPYRLIPATAERLRRLMDDLQLETGSIDLLQVPDGRQVFLEINPVGQFGMVSKPCNYGLERKVAELLIRKQDDAGRS